MDKLLKIAKSTIKEGIRQKIFIAITGLLVCFVFFSLFLTKISASEEIRVIRNFSIASIELCGLAIILFFVIQNFYEQKYTKIIDIFVIRFTKKNFLLGKIIGYLFLLLLFLIASYAIFSPVLIAYKAFYPGFLLAILTTFLKLSIITAFTILIATFFESATLTFMITIFFYISSEAASSARDIVKSYGSEIQNSAITVIYRILPNMDKLDIKSFITYGDYPDFSFLSLSVIYSTFYLVMLIAAALIIFEKKENV